MNTPAVVAVRRRAWLRYVYLLGLNAVIIIALVIVGITYVQLQTRKICGLIVLTDDMNRDIAQQQPPPGATAAQRAQYERARQFAVKVHEYRVSIGCPPTEGGTK